MGKADCAPEGDDLHASARWLRHEGLRMPLAARPAVALADRQGQILQVSAAFAGLFHDERLGLQGRRLQGLVHPDDRPELHAVLSQLRKGPRNDAALELRYLTCAQSARRCLTTLCVLRRRDGRLLSFLLVLQPLSACPALSLPVRAQREAAA